MWALLNPVCTLWGPCLLVFKWGCGEPFVREPCDGFWKKTCDLQSDDSACAVLMLLSNNAAKLWNVLHSMNASSPDILILSVIALVSNVPYAIVGNEQVWFPDINKHTLAFFDIDSPVPAGKTTFSVRPLVHSHGGWCSKRLRVAQIHSHCDCGLTTASSPVEILLLWPDEVIKFLGMQTPSSIDASGFFRLRSLHIEHQSAPL